MRERLVLEGDLQALLLPDVLTFLNMIKKTGRADFYREQTQKSIYWKAGDIVFATSTSEEDSLGKFLLRNARITRQQYEDSQRQLKPGQKHGKILVKMGLISPKDLWWGVQGQILDIIYSLFTWKTGKFLFFESPEEAFHQRIYLNTSTLNIIMEGVRRLDEWQRIKEKIPTPEMVFSPFPVEKNYLDGLSLDETERRVLEHIDGKTSVAELMRTLNLPEFDTHRALLTLIFAQVIAPAAGREAPVAEVDDQPHLLRIAQRYEGLFRRIFEDLQKAIGPLEAQHIMNRILKENPVSQELFEGATFNARGGFDANALIANISELPVDERRQVLDDTLNTLLSFFLFEVSQHMSAEAKTRLFADISTAQAEGMS